MNDTPSILNLYLLTARGRQDSIVDMRTITAMFQKQSIENPNNRPMLALFGKTEIALASFVNSSDTIEVVGIPNNMISVILPITNDNEIDPNSSGVISHAYHMEGYAINEQVPITLAVYLTESMRMLMFGRKVDYTLI